MGTFLLGVLAILTLRLLGAIGWGNVFVFGLFFGIALLMH